MEFFLWPFLFLLNPYFHGKMKFILVFISKYVLFISFRQKFVKKEHV